MVAEGGRRRDASDARSGRLRKFREENRTTIDVKRTKWDSCLKLNSTGGGLVGGLVLFWGGGGGGGGLWQAMRFQVQLNHLPGREGETRKKVKRGIASP